MPSKLIKKCPACGQDMHISNLKCANCGIEIKGDFEVPEDGNQLGLSDEDFQFVKVFLKHEGNFTKVQEEENISYLSLKDRLKELNRKLGNTIEESFDVKLIDGMNDKVTGKASQRIFDQLKEEGGSSYCEMLKGGSLKIWLTENGVCNSGYKGLVCEWKIFDAIVEKARELGGKMYKGDSAAQSGSKIGSNDLPVDTIDGFISLKFYGRHIGDSTLRRSTYYAAILAWAGICKNKRSQSGEASCIELMPEWI